MALFDCRTEHDADAYAAVVREERLARTRTVFANVFFGAGVGDAGAHGYLCCGSSSGAISVFNLDDVLRRSRDATRGAAAVSGEIAPAVVIRAHVGAAYAVVTYGDELLCTAGEDGRTLIFKVTDVVAAADAALAAGTPAVDADVRPVASFANPQERKSRGALGPVPETTALATDPSGGFPPPGRRRVLRLGRARGTRGSRRRASRPRRSFALRSRATRGEPGGDRVRGRHRPHLRRSFREGDERHRPVARRGGAIARRRRRGWRFLGGVRGAGRGGELVGDGMRWRVRNDVEFRGGGVRVEIHGVRAAAVAAAAGGYRRRGGGGTGGVSLEPRRTTHVETTVHAQVGVRAGHAGHVADRRRRRGGRRRPLLGTRHQGRDGEVRVIPGGWPMVGDANGTVS